MYNPDDFGTDIIDFITLEKFISKLGPQDQEILRLLHYDELTCEEIGKIVGKKYRGRPIAGSTIRYHRDRIMDMLRRWAKRSEI
jgi:DNA-directed RNA polymerase specialized sigma24 family protein